MTLRTVLTSLLTSLTLLTACQRHEPQHNLPIDTSHSPTLQPAEKRLTRQSFHRTKNILENHDINLYHEENAPTKMTYTTLQDQHTQMNIKQLYSTSPLTAPYDAPEVPPPAKEYVRPKYIRKQVYKDRIENKDIPAWKKLNMKEQLKQNGVQNGNKIEISVANRLTRYLANTDYPRELYSHREAARAVSNTELHEIGHLLGLDHVTEINTREASDERMNIMYPTGIPDNHNQRSFTTDQIAKMKNTLSKSPQ